MAHGVPEAQRQARSILIGYGIGAGFMVMFAVFAIAQRTGCGEGAGWRGRVIVGTGVGAFIAVQWGVQQLPLRTGRIIAVIVAGGALALTLLL